MQLKEKKRKQVDIRDERERDHERTFKKQSSLSPGNIWNSLNGLFPSVVSFFSRFAVTCFCLLLIVACAFLHK